MIEIYIQVNVTGDKWIFFGQYKTLEEAHNEASELIKITSIKAIRFEE